MVVVYTETRSVEVYIKRYEPTLRGDSWFSIYQISWIKIKKKLFENKRHHLVSSGGPRGRTRGAPLPPLFLDQTEARRAEKFFGDRFPYYGVWMANPPPPPPPVISRSGTGTG